MAQTELHETERVESPFARRTTLGTRSIAAAGGAPQRPTAETVDPQPAGARSAPDMSSSSLAPVRRLGVRPPRRLTGLRPLTGYEEELLEDGERATNSAALCNEILSRCLSPVGERNEAAASMVGALLVAERDTAIVDLRRLTFGDRMEMDVRCPDCESKNHVAFDLKQVSLEAADVAEAVEVTLSDGRVAHLRLPTARDQADLLEASLHGHAERRTWLLERALHKLGDREGPLGFETVHALDSGTRRELERELDRAIPDLDLRVGVTCDACSREFAAPFDIASFFLPS